MALDELKREQILTVLKKVDSICEFIQTGAPHEEIGKFTENTLKTLFTEEVQ